MSAVKGSDQPSHIADVIRRLRTIEASGSRSDGVVCFARLYREVTEGVGAELRRQGFADNRFLETLDVQFAALFFSALESYGRDPARTPSAWVPLFAQRSRRGIAPLQFALAGMNAHINRDLPVALVTTCRELGLDLGEGSAEHADFERVDVLLANVEARVKSQYVTGWLAWADLCTGCGASTTSWRCGTSDARATLPGRTRKHSGHSTTSGWQATICSHSTAWSASPAADFSFLPTRGCSNSAVRCQGRDGRRV
jgi:uncharacterized protein DUF5995